MPGNKGEEEALEEQAKQEIQDVKQEVDIAKDVATGNYVNAAKNAAKMAVNKTTEAIRNPEKFIKKKIKKFVIKYVVPFLATILMVIIIISMFIWIAQQIQLKIKEMITEPVEKVETFFDELIYEDGIVIKNEQALELVRSLEAQGITPATLGIAAMSEDEEDDEMKTLIQALDDLNLDDDKKPTKQEKAAIKYIKKFVLASKVSETINTHNNGLGHAGSIELKRYNAETGENVTMTYTDEINENVDSNHYTLDDSENIVVWLLQGDEWQEETIAYKDTMSQYSIPIMFFIDLCMVTQNPKYVEALAEEVINNMEIEVVLQESVTKIKTTTTRTETIRNDEDGTETENEISDTVTESFSSISPYITNVNHLLYSSTQECEAVQSNGGSSESEDTNYYRYYTELITVKTKIVSTTTNYTFSNDLNKDHEVKEKETDAFPTLTKTKYMLPMYQERKSAYSSLITDGELLFYLMDQNLDNEMLEQILKYMLNKITNKDYGVTELDDSLFDLNWFSSIDGLYYGANNEEKVWFAMKNFAMSLGSTEEEAEYAAAGVMGNVYMESGFQTTATNSSSGAYGICQWLATRKTDLINYASSIGEDKSSIDVQISFLIGECTSGSGIGTYQLYNANYRRAWLKATDVQTAVKNFYNAFERGGSSQYYASIRETNAQRLYNKYHGKQMPGGGGVEKVIGKNGIIKTYTTGGRTFSIFAQNQVGLVGQCNRAAAASIASGYSNASTALSTVKNAGSYIGSAQGSSDAYFSQFGLKINIQQKGYTYFKNNVAATIQSGKYMMIWMSTKSFGASGRQWAGQCHWVAILGYNPTNQKIYVSDSGWGNSGEWPITEFSGTSIYYVCVVSEK